MDVKAIQNVQPFQVNTADGAKDEERRRDLGKKQEKKKNKSAEATSAPPPAPVVENSTKDLELSRQIVDSEKVIQLLSFRPSESNAAAKLFSKNTRPTSAEKSSVIDVKKINKVL